jgi:hypothetical protein
LNELWVSAATAAEESAVFEDEDYDEDSGIEDTGRDTLDTPSRRPPSVSPYHERSPLLEIPDPSGAVPKPRLSGMGETGITQRILSGQHRVSSSTRRFSTISGHLPAIYANTGLQTPPAIAAAYEPDYLDRVGEETHPGLSAIQEGPANTASSPSRTVRINEEEVDEPEVKPDAQESNFKALPKLIILQYGLLAFHDTGPFILFKPFTCS